MHLEVGEGFRVARSEGFRHGRPGDAPRKSAPNFPPNAARDPEGGQFQALGLAIARTVLPVAALIAVIAAAYLYRDEPFGASSGADAWLPLGALGIPLSFLAIHLTNRRYGPAVAVAQVVATWLIVAVLALGPQMGMGWEIPGLSGIERRMMLAVAAALALSHLVAVVAFDATRSRRWGTAPMHGFFWGSFAFAFTCFPAAYVSTGAPWLEHMAICFAVLLGTSVLLLPAYWAARPLVHPLDGLAGY